MPDSRTWSLLSNVVYKCTETDLIVVFLLQFFLFGALSFSSGLLVVLVSGQPGACMVVAVAAAVIDVETKLLDTASEYFMEHLVHKPEDVAAVYVVLTVVCRICFKVLLPNSCSVKCLQMSSRIKHFYL